MTGIALTMAFSFSACGNHSSNQNIDIVPNKSSEANQDTSTEHTEDGTVKEITMEFESVSYTAVAIQNVRIRTTPEKLSDNIYRQLDAGKGIKVIGYNEEWCKVVYDDMIMYVATEYLVEGEPVEDSVTTVYANGTTNTKPVVEANGKKVAIDAGHQKGTVTGEEAIGPDAEEETAKQTLGNTSASNSKEEYVLTLEVAMYLKEELLNRGYEVFMIREKDKCTLSEAERATEASNSGSDIFVSLHANNSEDENVSGALTIAPSNENPYVTDTIEESLNLCTLISTYMTQANGFQNHGVLRDDNMANINWSTIPTAIVEMGFLSNQNDAFNMADEVIQKAIARGIANGIDAYFGFETEEEITEEVMQGTIEETNESTSEGTEESIE